MSHIRRRRIFLASLLIVGSIASASVTTRAFAAGSRWRISPTPGLDYNGFLKDVSCSTATSCAAVGSEDVFGFDQTLIEMWDGTSWKIAKAPTTGAERDYLGSVSCTSPTQCVAVGEADGDNPLIETWNGTKWSVASQSLPQTFMMSAVSCASATACTAVGSSYAQQGARPISAMWNGMQWSVVPMPSKSPTGPRAFYESHAFGVSCANATACRAVGDVVNDENSQQPLVEKWNGTKWSIKPSADLSGVEGGFADVACAAANRCTAAGSTSSLGNTPLAEQWDGSAWSVSDLPHPDFDRGFLSGASCPNGTHCAVVGSYLAGPSGHQNERNLVEARDGAAWSLITTPAVANANDELAAVSCPTGHVCFAVGTRASETNGSVTTMIVTGRL